MGANVCVEVGGGRMKKKKAGGGSYDYATKI